MVFPTGMEIMGLVRRNMNKINVAKRPDFNFEFISENTFLIYPVQFFPEFNGNVLRLLPVDT